MPATSWKWISYCGTLEVWYWQGSWRWICWRRIRDGSHGALSFSRIVTQGNGAYRGPCVALDRELCRRECYTGECYNLRWSTSGKQWSAEAFVAASPAPLVLKDEPECEGTWNFFGAFVSQIWRHCRWNPGLGSRGCLPAHWRISDKLLGRLHHVVSPRSRLHLSVLGSKCFFSILNRPFDEPSVTTLVVLVTNWSGSNVRPAFVEMRF